MATLIKNNLTEVLTALNMAKSTFYWRKSQGLISVEMVTRAGKKQLKVTVGDDDMSTNVESILGHKRYVAGWIQWRDRGYGFRVWSDSYKKKLVGLSKSYFAKYDAVSAKNLIAFMDTATNISCRRNRHAFVSSIAKYLVQEGILGQEEADKIKRLYPRKDPYYEPNQKLIAEFQVEDIIAAVDEPDPYNQALVVTLIKFLVLTGLRISEATSLTLKQLYFSDLSTGAYLKDVRGKGGRLRRVPFVPEAQKVIREYLKIRPAGLKEPLFVRKHSTSGKLRPMNSDWITRRFTELSKSTGIEFGAHSFRHIRLTKWYNDPQIPIPTTMKWVGHSSMHIAQTYIHVTDDLAMAHAYKAG